MKAQIHTVGHIVDGKPRNFIFTGSLTGVFFAGKNEGGDEVYYGWTLDELTEKVRERDAALQEPGYLELVRRLRE